MLDKLQTESIIRKNFPGDDLKFMAEYRGLHIYRVITPGTPPEEVMDPFFSVNQATGELRDFSVLTDISLEELSRLFPTIS